MLRQGYGLLIHDAYRPWWVTKVFWEATPVQWRKFVANPAEGSRHNRGCAVDLTLYELRSALLSRFAAAVSSRAILGDPNLQVTRVCSLARSFQRARFLR